MTIIVASTEFPLPCIKVADSPEIITVGCVVKSSSAVRLKVRVSPSFAQLGSSFEEEIDTTVMVGTTVSKVIPVIVSTVSA